MSTPHVIATRHGAVLDLELARREKKNAITTAMYVDLASALGEAAVDDSLGAVLVHGQPDLFTAGNDLGDFLDPRTRETRGAQRFIRAIADFPKPLVAAVGGPVIGIGVTMLLHCDLVYATPSAQFQLPFVSLGLCPEAGSTALLPAIVGQRAAAELLLLGQPIDASRAHTLGLVNAVVDDAQLLERALAVAQRLAAEPSDAMRTTKALLRAVAQRERDAAIAAELIQFERLLGTETARAIFSRFLQRRT